MYTDFFGHDFHNCMQGTHRYQTLGMLASRVLDTAILQPWECRPNHKTYSNKCYVSILWLQWWLLFKPCKKWDARAGYNILQIWVDTLKIWVIASRTKYDILKVIVPFWLQGLNAWASLVKFAHVFCYSDPDRQRPGEGSTFKTSFQASWLPYQCSRRASA